MASRKNSMFPMPTSSGIVPKVIGTMLLIAIVSIVIKHPSEAANFATGLFGLLGAAIDGVISFLRQVAS
jgi:hypothetical protein